MAQCTGCGQDILFGGRKINGRRYCNDKCAATETVHAAADGIPLELVQKSTLEIFDGACPRCGGPGPVDVRKSTTVVSYLIGISWWSKNHITCSKCARREQIQAAIITGLIGWISVPGLLVAPAVVIRNVYAATRRQQSTIPSEELEQFVRYQLVQFSLSAGTSSPLQAATDRSA
jgi:hypothetical protein